MTTIQTNLTDRQITMMGGDPNASVEILDVIQLVTDHASITEITAIVQRDLVKVTGTARRSPEDKPNRQIGQMLATARAYNALGRTVERRARGLVEHHADIKVQRPVQRLKSEIFKQRIAAVASADDNVQKAVIRQIREQEGTWVPKAMRAAQHEPTT